MKLNKFALPLVLALVAAVAVTGCKKGFNGKVTNIPGHNTPIVGSQPTDISTLPPATPFDPNASSQPKSDSLPTGPIKYSDSRPFNLSDYDQDRAALAEQTVHFAFDSSAILSKEENKLVIVAEKLKSDPSAKLLIEGHCDERGTDEYNRALGERRGRRRKTSLWPWPPG